MTDLDRRLTDLVAARTPIQVGILLFPEVEVLDFAGPFEVFSVVARLSKQPQWRGYPAFDVSTVAREAGPVVARHGLGVVAGHGFATAPAFDILVVPGGVVDQPLADAATLDFVRARSATAALTLSVCTGAFVLARAGLLTGRRVTTHWEDIADLRTAHPELDVVKDVAFVDEGRVMTSAGISAGIELSLHAVGRILGREMARATARQMQFETTVLAD